MSQNKKLESIALWQKTIKVADYIESILPEIPDDERWGAFSKLRNRALDLTSDAAEAYGSIDPRDVKWHFGAARRDAFGLKSVLKVSHIRKYVTIEPKIMLLIEEIIDDIDVEIKLATKNISKWYEEMHPPITKGEKNEG